MLYLPIAIFLIILIRLLKPFVTVRIFGIDFSRFGRAEAGNWYISETQNGLHDGKYFDLFFFNTLSSFANKQWIKMWRRVLKVFPFENLGNVVFELNRVIPGYQVHEIPIAETLPRNFNGNLLKIKNYEKRLQSVLNSDQQNISFTPYEEKFGSTELEKLGIPAGSSFICFHARDPAYLDTVNSEIDWKYHDYRNSSIQNYVLAAEKMTQRGCYAVRVGFIVKERIKSLNQKVFDYAYNGMRTDFLDIYLSAKCRFFLCSDGGISAPPEIFKRPMVYVNWPIIQNVSVYVSRGLIIFKKFFLKSENRYMSFSEIMKLEFGGSDTNEIFSKLNLNLIENTPEEILDVTIEMDERLNGTWVSCEEDEELQDCFWALFGPNKLKSPDLRIGANFLRQNKDLLN